MSPDRTAPRVFAVHGAGAAAPRSAHLLEGTGFLDAALRFVEEHHPPADAHDEVSLIVEDCGSGERQCFRIDLATGETGPCE